MLAWHTVITVQSPRFKSLNFKTGHPTNDHFIFLSKSESLLLTLMSSDSILNGLSRKYGIFLENNLINVGYIVEPPHYTGSVITYSSVNIQKIVNNFNGRQLKVAYISYPPLLYKDENGNFNGVHCLVVAEIAKVTNHSLQLYGDIRSPGFGRQLSNGTWTGLVGELVSRRADIAIIGMSLERLPFVDFPKSTKIEPFVMCLRNPIGYRPWHALIGRLTPFVWLCLLFTFMTIIVSLKLLGIFVEGKEKKRTSLSAVVLGIFGIFMEQSFPTLEKNTSKCLLIIWIIFSYLIGTAYRSHLVSFLTFTVKDHVPETFDELYEDTSYSVILYSTLGLELNLFKKSKNSAFKGIGDRMFLERNATKCLLNAATSKTVCLGWQSLMTSVFIKDTDGKLNNLHFAKKWGSTTWVGAAFKKDSIFTESFGRYIEILRASALMDFWHEKSIRDLQMENFRKVEEHKKGLTKQEMTELRIHQEENDSRHALNVSVVLIIFVMTIVGILLALICFFIEILTVFQAKCL